jgi:spore coat assembly protein SafA
LEENHNVRIHIVQKGDTMWKIAKKYGVDFHELLRLNSQIITPDVIYPGAKIKIPPRRVPVHPRGEDGARQTPQRPIKEAPLPPMEEEELPPEVPPQVETRPRDIEEEMPEMPEMEEAPPFPEQPPTIPPIYQAPAMPHVEEAPQPPRQPVQPVPQPQPMPPMQMRPSMPPMPPQMMPMIPPIRIMPTPPQPPIIIERPCPPCPPCMQMPQLPPMPYPRPHCPPMPTPMMPMYPSSSYHAPIPQYPHPYQHPYPHSSSVSSFGESSMTERESFSSMEQSSTYSSDMHRSMPMQSPTWMMPYGYPDHGGSAAGMPPHYHMHSSMYPSSSFMPPMPRQEVWPNWEKGHEESSSGC